MVLETEEDHLTVDDLEMSLYTYKAKCRRVVDGDTLDLELDLGLKAFRHERVRLYGLDTPETYGVKKDSEEYRAGQAAAAFVTNRVFHAGSPTTPKDLWVETHKDSTGKYGRYLATIWYTELDEDGVVVLRCLNDELVNNGHAEHRSY